MAQITGSAGKVAEYYEAEISIASRVTKRLRLRITRREKGIVKRLKQNSKEAMCTVTSQFLAKSSLHAYGKQAAPWHWRTPYDFIL